MTFFGVKGFNFWKSNESRVGFNLHEGVCTQEEKALKLTGFFFLNWWRRRESNPRSFFQGVGITTQFF